MRLLVAWLLAWLASPALAAGKVRVVTTIPDLAWAAQVIGGELVEATPLLTGRENPHFVEPVPAFVAQVAEADVVCLVGLDLEAGWLPRVLERAGNRRVAPGGRGYCDVGHEVPIKEKPAVAYDASKAVHPLGNPHYWLSPRALAGGAREIEAVLERVDPRHREAYQRGLARLTAELDETAAKVAGVLQPLARAAAGRAVVMEYHREFVYFLEAYGLTSFGGLETQAGAAPSARRLADVAGEARAAGVRVVLAAPYDPARTLARFHEVSGLPVVTMPTSIQPEGTLRSYGELQLAIAEALVKAAGAAPAVAAHAAAPAASATPAPAAPSGSASPSEAAGQAHP